MSPDRPNPDELLAVLKAEESNRAKGKLKIFFGYAAGVGKTYAMLAAARHAKAAGREVVVGYVEPHGRPDTEALLEGLETLPTQPVDHRGVVLREFDLDGAITRHPELLLVDELAHTNAEGCRNAKRWQDVAELLDAGINVWTTLNVQHIESLNDVIGQITGVTVRETVPDRIFEIADDLELVDISPEELLVRLREGKIYIPSQAERALQHFFQKPNLTALRELSLRQTARLVHSEVESARRQQAATVPWATADRLLVCVGPSPTTQRVIRTAKQMAAALDAAWIAVCVEKTGIAADPAARHRIADHLRLAARLGAETVTLTGSDVPQTILDFARAQNVTKIFIGKSHVPRWKRLFARGVVDELLDSSGDIDVYVIQGRGEPARQPAPVASRNPIRWQDYAASAGVTLAGSLLAAGLHKLGLAEANIVMVFLAVVAFIAYRYGRGPAIQASVASVIIFDVLFVPPEFSLTVHDTQYLVTFAALLGLGLLISMLTARLQVQLASGVKRERRTLALYRLSKQLGALAGDVFLVNAAGKHVREMVGGEVAIYLEGDISGPRIAFGEESSIARHPHSAPTAHWVMTHDAIAGQGTDTLPNAAALFVPLSGSQSTLGAIAVRADAADWLVEPEFRQWLESCANQLALALERDRMTVAAGDARVKAEAEQIRSTLLSSVSHDLKTPLAAIAGASSSLLQNPPPPDTSRRELLETISEEAIRLNRLLENILQISRLDAGAVAPVTQWQLLEDIVGSALHRTRSCRTEHPVTVRIEPDVPLILVDGLLIEQVFMNLLENAARYTPAGTPIEIQGRITGSSLEISVADRGPGLVPGTEETIFDRYYRGTNGADAGRGSGLGLAICRAIVRLHGGTIRAAQRSGGGAEVVIRLPLAKDPPPLSVGLLTEQS